MIQNQIQLILGKIRLYCRKHRNNFKKCNKSKKYKSKKIKKIINSCYKLNRIYIKLKKKKVMMNYNYVI
jgi:hypothetical protein